MDYIIHDKTSNDAEHNSQNKDLGLSTRDALNILKQEILKTLNETEREKKLDGKSKKWIKDALHHKSRCTTFCWTSALALLIDAIILITIYFCFNETLYFSLPFEGLIICFLVIFNISLVIIDNKLRHAEIPNRVRTIVEQIEVFQNICKWESQNYPHLCSPLSPCVTLQCTYRDGKIVNLPWALLVVGDIVVIRPGQQSPGYCIPCDSDDGPILYAGDMYSPSVPQPSEVFTTPQARKPRQNKLYKLQETPFVKNLRLALDHALDRPVTFHNRKRHLVINFTVEQLLHPIVLIFVVFVNVIRYLYLRDYVASGHWSEMLMLQPIATVLPLLPLAFPFCWLLLNSLGMARFKALFMSFHRIKKTQNVDPFEDTDISDKSCEIDVKYNWLEIFKYSCDFLRGREFMMFRSANILHVLGSVTALCCVDKKGILSWPNPTAEKVFFLRNTAVAPKQSSTENIDNAPKEEVSKEVESATTYVQNDVSTSTVEVLDLTHDHELPFRLQFDDQTWRQHINSLKPLGLAILLNTCNMNTQEHYSQFCCHVTCEAFYNESLVPVTNRRCLCELAKQIGFQEQAQEVFLLKQQLSTFRHVQPEMVRRDIKFAKSLQIGTKLKFPFPHMMAVVVQEHNSGSLQLLTQGTADVILDSCIEFWDGQDISPLSVADRKKVQDFYQRTSLTSYCTAFAYRPITKNVSNKFSDVYIELPLDCKHLYMPQRSPTPLPWDLKNPLDPKIKGIYGQFYSTDSLLRNENKDSEIDDIEGCFELQCNQIFIGMVTMQYQAQTDMVQLIEQLERACIRFVHFSKENELRSRVFSEKMGLESGWNCHISLLSERTRPESPLGPGVSRSETISSLDSSLKNKHHKSSLAEEASHLLNASRARTNLTGGKIISLSAPSAISTEYATVKFDNDNAREKDNFKTRCWVGYKESDSKLNDDNNLSNTNIECGPEEWRSMSCLTDSTEQSAPVNFDLSNRAKLPRGIDKIRPHLECIDNVPLLVSLFTDCNTTVTREMLHIMQDYGEIVCVLGSTANADNMPIFMQADVAIGVEPLYPQVCQRVPVYIPVSEDHGISPTDLSRMLNSVICSLNFKREDSVAISHLIQEARHYMKCLWNCVQFWLCCMVTLSAVQMLSSFLLLPPLFTVGQVLWMVLLIVPLLSLSLIATPMDPNTMLCATEKNQCDINLEVFLFTIWCYGSKFIITIITIVSAQGIMLMIMCPLYTKSESQCFYVYPDVMSNKTWGGWNQETDVVLGVQHYNLILLVLHYVILSMSFVHREYLLFRKYPGSNVVWAICACTVIVLQIVFSGRILLKFWSDDTDLAKKFPVHVVYYSLLSMPLILIVNETVKWQEIKMNVRYQKRARLEFGTKLGMNSPF